MTAVCPDGYRPRSRLLPIDRIPRSQRRGSGEHVVASCQQSGNRGTGRCGHRGLDPFGRVARPIEDAMPNVHRDAVASSGVQSESSSFDLPSAAIGAAGGTGVVLVLLAGGGLARRRTDTGRSAHRGAV
jgi:hypothetical protein